MAEKHNAMPASRCSLLTPSSNIDEARFQAEPSPFKRHSMVREALQRPSEAPLDATECTMRSKFQEVASSFSPEENQGYGWLDNAVRRWAIASEMGTAEGVKVPKRAYSTGALDIWQPLPPRQSDDVEDGGASDFENNDHESSSEGNDGPGDHEPSPEGDDEPVDNAIAHSSASPSTGFQSNTKSTAAEPSPYDIKVIQLWPLVEKGITLAAHDPSARRCYILDDTPYLRVELLPYQREGIGQLEQMEKDHRAWILADDMGLGKTLQVITLIARDRARGTTGSNLVVVPATLAQQWANEIKNFVHKGFLSVLEYFNGEKIKKLGKIDFNNWDIVITTYDRLAAQYRCREQAYDDWRSGRAGFREKLISKAPAPRKTKPLVADRVKVPLMSHQWLRVVLDEAHRVRNADRSRHKAVQALKRGLIGCMTGTPMQNGYADFASLCGVMRISPLSDSHFFASCFIKNVDGSPWLTKKLHQNLELCLAAIRKALCVRRVNGNIYDGQRIQGCPPAVLHYEDVTLDNNAQKIQDEWKDLFDPAAKSLRAKQVSDGTAPKRDSEPGAALRALQRMHMACIHPDLHEAKYGDTGEKVTGILPADLTDDELLRIVEDGTVPERQPDESDGDDKPRPSDVGIREKFIAEKMKNDRWQSPKVNATIHLCKTFAAEHKARVASQSTELEKRIAKANGKTIIFSPYVCGNDMVACGLRKAGIGFYEVNGFFNDAHRKEVLRKFEERNEKGLPKDFNNEEPDEVEFLLVTLAIGQEGINLVHASNMIFLSRSWNPAVEAQAVARAARMGQRNEVHAYFLTARDSIEVRIEVVQADKRAKAKGIMAEDMLRENRWEMAQWTITDLNSFITHSGSEQPTKQTDQEAMDLTEDDPVFDQGGEEEDSGEAGPNADHVDDIADEKTMAQDEHGTEALPEDVDSFSLTSSALQHIRNRVQAASEVSSDFLR